MERRIQLLNRTIDYHLRISPRARHLRLEVHAGGKLIAVLPRHLDPLEAERFIRARSSWILRAVEYYEKRPTMPIFSGGRREYLRHKEAARRLAHVLVARLNAVYGLRIGRITIRNQRSRWGSCSKIGNLNFNYRIALLPERCAEYIVAHELCHIAVFDHSKAFWALVARTIPEHKIIRRQLR